MDAFGKEQSMEMETVLEMIVIDVIVMVEEFCVPLLNVICLM